MASNLTQRLTVAAIGIPAVLMVVWIGGGALAGLVALLGVLGAHELFVIARRNRDDPLLLPGLVGAALIGPGVWLAQGGSDVGSVLRAMWPLGMVAWLLLLLVILLGSRTPTSGRPLTAVSVTVFGVMYCGALPAFLVAIRHAQHGLFSWQGTWITVFPLAITWVCDTAAMVAGKVIGGPKLAPVISPGKTRVGAAAGVVGGIVGALIFSEAILHAGVGVELSLAEVLVFGLVLSIVAQLGDLVESLLKREAGVKDSSGLIPGHGGVLDRLDSLYFVLPVAFGLYRAFGIL